MDRLAMRLVFGLAVVTCLSITNTEGTFRFRCPRFRCLQWIKCGHGNVEIWGCPICLCKQPPTTTKTPELCLTCCGPPPCCNNCLQQPTQSPIG